MSTISPAPTAAQVLSLASVGVNTARVDAGVEERASVSSYVRPVLPSGLLPTVLGSIILRLVQQRS